jgi:1,2-diacylglycerol 3-alpha-glucosyltransferase
MLDLETLPAEQIKAVFSDLDGTITDGEAGISDATYEALWNLKRAHKKIVIVSGRPAGWADALMRLWPVNCVIFENGAGILLREGSHLRTVTLASDKPLAEQRTLLETTFHDLKRDVPSLKLASDQEYRRFDYALDYAEEPPFLPVSDVERLMALLKLRPELTAKLSSIHINYWYGKHTKVTACKYLLEKEKEFAGLKREEIVYCGDSPNDEPLFEFFPNAVGVANVKAYVSQMRYLPRFIANEPGGRGFAEIVGRLLRQAR